MGRRTSSKPPRIKSWREGRTFHNIGSSEITRAFSRRGKHGPEKRKLSHPDFTHAHFRRWRKSRGYTQAELGLIFNVKQYAISTWESDLRSMPSDLIERLADLDDDIRQTKDQHGFDLDAHLAGYRDGLDQWQIPYTLQRTPLETPHFAQLHKQAQRSGELGKIKKNQTQQNSTDKIKFDPFIK